MEEVISLLGFYLAMVALLCSIFFTRIEVWHAEVKSASGLWAVFSKRNPTMEELREHHRKAISLQNALPWRGFALVATFLFMISACSVMLAPLLSGSSVPIALVLVPGAVFEVFFFVGSGWLLISGQRSIDATVDSIKARL